MNPERLALRLITEPCHEDLPQMYEELRRQGPMTRTPFGVVVVVDYFLGREILRAEGFGVSNVDRMNRVWPDWPRHPVVVQLLSSMFGNDGPTHAEMRAPFRASLSERGVSGLEGFLGATANDRLSAVLKRVGPVDLIADFARPLALQVMLSVLGLHVEDAGALAAPVEAWTAALELHRTTETIARADEAVLTINRFVMARLSEPDDSQPQSLFSQVRRDWRRGSDMELIANLSILLVAGVETTTTFVSNCLAAEAAHNRELSLSRTLESVSIDAWVAEANRMWPPLQVATRVATQDLSVNGIDFRSGEDVLVLVGACNRDPSAFERPEVFDPSVRRRQSLTFGGGAHHCLGVNLARRVAYSVLTCLAQRQVEIRWDVPPSRSNRLVLNGVQDWPVNLIANDRYIFTPSGELR